MYEKTITLFNRYDNNGTIMWIPHVLGNVDLNIDKAAIVEKYGENAKDTAKLHIRYAPQNKISGLQFVYPKEFKAIAYANVGSYITFAEGEDFDFFWLGTWTAQGNVSDDSYLNGFYDYMQKAYDNVFAVTSCAKYFCIPHFEITGK